MAKLIIRDGKGGDLVHEIKDDVTSFGRSSANIIQMKDEKASRQHFRIEKAGDSYRLVDLGSRNGTEVNGVKVSSQTLRPGDVIVVGEYKVVFDAPIQVSGEELGATVAVDPLSEKEAAAPGKPEPPAAPAAAASEKPVAPRFVLEVAEGASKGQVVELGLEPVTIGRNAANKLCIDDEAASNFHAEVTKEAIGYVISDLGSTNGTKVNGEKIVKSPLAHNARIRIGSAEIVFKNLGAPTEEDAVFGTVVLDSDKLDKELVAARSSGGGAAFLKVAAVLVLLAGVGYGAYYGVKRLVNRPVVPVRPIFSHVRNPFFGDGTDATGNPKDWSVAVEDTRNAVMVDTTDGREKPIPPQTQAEKYSLKFQRETATPANTRIECRQGGDFQVEKDKGYLASVYVKCPGAQGIYGLRLTWLESDEEGRKLDDYTATISGPHPEWYKVEVRTLPPGWAGKLRLALVACGNSGNVWFDDVALDTIPTAEATRTEQIVDYHGVKASLDAVGRLDLERLGARALSGQIVAQGQGKLETRQELARPAQGYPRQQGEETIFKGSIFDFSRRDRFNYEEAASKAGDGVRVRYSFSTDGKDLTLEDLALQFLVEPAFAGKAEAYTAAGKKLLSEGDNPGVTELVLHSAGGGNVLALSFAQPALVKMKALGEKIGLTVDLAANPSLGVAPKEFTLTFASVSRSALAEIDAAFAMVFKLFDDKNWKDFPAASAAIRQKHPGAAEQLKKLGDLDAQYKKALEDARKLSADAVKRAEQVKDNPDALVAALDQGKKTVEELQKDWPAGTALAEHLGACLVALEGLKESIRTAEEEKAAKEFLDKAIKAMDNKLWTIAQSYLKTILTKYPKTKCAEQAKKLVPVCEDAIRQIEMISKEEDRILKSIRNDEANSLWDDAIRKIKTDPSYVKYGKEMPEATRKLEELEAKKAGPK